jgi:hypothetical protein
MRGPVSPLSGESIKKIILKIISEIAFYGRGRSSRLQNNLSKDFF